MDREQKEYVRKQEDKRRKAQRMRSTGECADDDEDYFTFGNPDLAFNNFFKVIQLLVFCAALA